MNYQDDNNIDDLELEILSANYWEHFKFAKDIALILPLNHPKRVKLAIELNEMSDKMNNLKKETNDKTNNR